MGFLKHDTNEIVIDAVLTNRGRELLAKNNGQFRIVHYGFADDEVDYTIIKKFGRTVGTEKIEKNTPVFEAQTISAIAIKHPLITLSNPTLTVYPSLAVASGVNTSLQNKKGSNLSQITINQQIPNSTSGNVQALLRETQYRVTLDSRFLTIQGKSAVPRTVPFSPNLVYDLVASSAGSGATLSTLSFVLKVTSSGSNLTSFQDSSNTVVTVVKVDGLVTGCSANFEVQVQY